MKELFLLSGLGADERVYNYLDFGSCKLNFIKWIEPQKKETIEHYATRLLDQIKVSNPILIGVSFGGMMAIEIAKQIPTSKVILISSARTKHDLPFGDGFLQKIKFHRILPLSLPQRIPSLMYWLFGAKVPYERKLLKSILADTDVAFSSWAIDKIITWRNEFIPDNVIHIHGTADRMIPYSQANYTIDNGGHFMVVNRADEVSKIINHELSLLPDTN